MSSSMSNSSLSDPPTGKRLEPIGTENPAVYIEPRDTVLTAGDVNKPQPIRGVGVGGVTGKVAGVPRSGGGAVDVRYSSGMTTIRIAGTPVTKRKQIFEDQTTIKKTPTSSLDTPQLRSNVPNSLKNSLIRNKEENLNKTIDSYAISTTIPFVPEINDDDIKPETVITDLNGNEVKGDNLIGSSNKVEQSLASNNGRNELGSQTSTLQQLEQRQSTEGKEDVEPLYAVPNKRKKVKFHHEVVVNQDERTTLEMGSTTGSETEQEVNDDVFINNSKTSVLTNSYSENLDVVYTDGSTTEVMPQKDFSFMNNGFTPIVDEYELRELSRRLSSKEKEGPALPEAPHIQSVEITSNMSEPNKSSELSKNSKGSSERSDTYSNSMNIGLNSRAKRINTSSVIKPSAVSAHDRKSNRRLTWCLWVALCALVLTVAALLILGVIYAVRVASNSESGAKDDITRRLSLVQSQSTDIFTSALKSTSSISLQYYLIDRGSVMVWQAPENNTVLSWHKGGIVEIVQVSTSAGGPLTTTSLGDVSQNEGVTPSSVLTPEFWYAARLTSEDYALVSFASPNSELRWNVVEKSTITALHQAHAVTIETYFSSD